MRAVGVSQYEDEPIGLQIWKGSVLTDPDVGTDVTVTITAAGAMNPVVDQAIATREDVGKFIYTVDTAVTAALGVYDVLWEWTLDGEDRKLPTSFEVVIPQLYWDPLIAGEKMVVTQVYADISDGYDSTQGGPYLWEMRPQSSFSFDTVARLMTVNAMAAINYRPPKEFVPPFTVGAGPRPFPDSWYGLLHKATLVELLKHLRRSYVEIPLAQNVSTARLDRRDYWDRWGAILKDEQAEFDGMLSMLKRKWALSGAKTRALLIAGGLFPMSYLDPARPRWPYVIARI